MKQVDGSPMVSEDQQTREPELGAAELLDIRRRLRYHLAMGIGTYPLTDEVKRFLRTSRPEAVPVTPVNRSAGKKTSRREQPPGPPPRDRKARESGLAALASEIGACTLCGLARTRQAGVVGRGAVGAKLMVVGDWTVQGGAGCRDVLFGPEEDEMLWRMMAAINLDQGQVYVTNCVKCSPVPSGGADARAQQRCFSYLTREIGAVRPRLICAMGEVAARLLLGSNAPLVRLRGRFHDYRYQGAETVPVMPTFHPRFLLRHEEMKRAAWNDLQLVRRRLDTIGV